MKKVILILIFVFIMPLSFAVDSKSTRETLSGSSGLIVATLLESKGKQPISEDELKRIVELRMRNAGIRLYDFKEPSNFPTTPILSVYVYSMYFSEVGDFYFYGITAEVWQPVRLIKEVREGVDNPRLATTWSKHPVFGNFNVGEEHNLIESIQNYVDDFINIYLSVNPK
jgi:hypothetical protein